VSTSHKRQRRKTEKKDREESQRRKTEENDCREQRRTSRREDDVLVLGIRDDVKGGTVPVRQDVYRGFYKMFIRVSTRVFSLQGDEG
jgi:hypothetical protein